MSAAETNVVTLRIPAALYALLVAELEFAASIAGRAGMNHSPENARLLHRLLLEQGGVRLDGAEREPGGRE